MLELLSKELTYTIKYMANLESFKTVFILGVKGVAMAQIASILKKMGKDVVGYDTEEEFITDEELHKQNITIYTSEDKIPSGSNFDLAIYSAAHSGDSNSIIKKLKNEGVTIVSQAEFLNQLSKLFKKTIAVCGAHGKTTASALLSYALIKLGANPSYIVGSSSFDEYPAGDFQSKDYLVLEADEYGVNPPTDKTPKFHFLHPSLTLCTNIDFDHPDVFDSIEDVVRAYEKFFKQSEYCIVCADDNYAVDTAKKAGVQFHSYGFSEDATMRIINHEVDTSGSSFDLIRGEKVIKDIKISLYGDHNIANAAGAYLVLQSLGFEEFQIKNAVKEFKGAKRRFEVVYSKDGLTVVDDYAHHPVEIKAIIKASFERYGTKPVVIFQPHTYSRTQALLEEFSSAFSQAEHAYIMPIFASARENKDSFTVTHEDLVTKATERGFEAIESVSGKEELMAKLSSKKTPTVIMTLGAGDVYKLHSDIIRVLS